MANLVEFLVRMKDLASGPLNQLANNGSNAFNRLQNGVSRFVSKMNTVKMSLNDIEKRLEELTKAREISLDGRQIRRINQEIAELEKRRDNLSNSNRSGGLGSFFRSALGFAGIAGLATLGTSIMKSGMERSMNQTSFEVLGGKRNGDIVNAQLLKFAKDTIYGNEVFEEGKLLLGSGVKARNVLPVENMLGDIAMGNVERMKSLNLAFAETASTGKLTGRQNLMFRTALFNPLQQLHEMTGKSVASLEEDMSKGKIGVDMLVKAMEHATGVGGRWHNMMQKLQNTPAGQWQAFTGTLSTMAGTIGLSLLPVLGGLLNYLNAFINNTPLLYGVAAGIAAMTAAWALYTAWTQRAVIWQTILNIIAFWPIAVIGALIGLITYLIYKYDGWGKSLKALWEIIKSFCGIVVILFKEMVEQLVYAFEYLWLKAKGTFELIGGMVGNTINALKLALHGDWGGAKKALTAHITTDADAELDKLQKSRREDQNANAMGIVGKLNNIGQQWKNVGLHASKDSGKSPLDALTNGFSNGAKFDSSGIANASGDTSKAITGGGVRNITINMPKFQDKTEIHVTKLDEDISQVEDILRDMFLRLTNSAASALN